MKYITRDLLTLLISLFILSSCEGPDEVGLDIDPANQINSAKIDTSTVRTVTVLDDSLLTLGLALHPVGSFQDFQVGSTEANLAAGLNLPSLNLTFGNSPILDSAVLVLKYGNEFFGDISSTYTLDVRQLNERFNSAGAYYNTKEWNVNSQVIGSKVIQPSLLGDSIKITNIVKGAVDTQKLVPGQIRIPLSRSFIVSNFFDAASDNFVSQAKFTNFIKGLYVTFKKDQSEFGGLVFLDLSDASTSGLDLYYRNDNSSTIDTNYLHFGIVNTTAASSIKHTYLPEIRTQLNNPTQQYSKVFLQPMGGLRTKISFPNIQALSSLGKIIINKAELEIHVEPGTDAFGVAKRLAFYRTDLAKQRQPLPDNNYGQTGAADPRVLSEQAFGGFYDATKSRYTFVITSYIQDLISGKLPQYDAYIAPIYSKLNPTQSFLPSTTGSTGARAIVVGGNSSNPNMRMRLNIVYTKID